MGDVAPGVLLLIALAFAFVLFRRLHMQGGPPPGQSGAPAGAATVQLGQFAVAPSRQWLIVQPGQ